MVTLERKEEVVIRKGQEKGFWDAGNVLFLDLGDGGTVKILQVVYL